MEQTAMTLKLFTAWLGMLFLLALIPTTESQEDDSNNEEPPRLYFFDEEYSDDKYLMDHVPGSMLQVCAVEHGRHEPRTKYQSKASRYGFHRVRLESLFVMDREQYLPLVKKNEDFSVQIQECKLDEITTRLELMYAERVANRKEKITGLKTAPAKTV